MAKVTPTRPTAAAQNKPDKKAKKSAHPLVGSKDATKYPFSALPTDYNFGTMSPLKKKNFATEAAFFEYKAAEAESKAKDFRTRAEQSKLTGDGKQKQKARRLLKMQDKMAELRKQLEEQGIDVTKLMESTTTAAKEEPAKK